MKWPTPQEYNEAIQNCRTNFRDPELQKFSPEVNKLGMPKPCSGQFATVYRVSNGAQSLAVRCFLNHYPDQEARYAAISAHLNAKNLPCMVPFEFQKKGIRVNGEWFPILKMEWIGGEKIDAYLFKNLANQAALNDIASRWLSMMKLLRDTGIAHGDLQHGNIIVSQGSLKLIDYDGMFVPALKGYATHEVGHRNYQHPKRTNADFSADLDNFSAWVIYASIVGFGFDKNLWAHAKAGDERLMLSECDYRNPAQSDILARMSKSGDGRLKFMAEQLARFPSLPVLQVPKLDASNIPNSAAPNSGAGGTAWWKQTGTPQTANMTVAQSASMPAASFYAAKICPMCAKRLVERRVPGMGIPYWQCENAPTCKYVKNDGEDAAHLVVPAAVLNAVPSNSTAGSTANTGLVFLDPTATGSPFLGATPSTPSAGGNSPAAAPPCQRSGYYTASTSTGNTTTQRNRRQAKQACPYCGGATLVTKTATPQRMCFQYPTCMYMEQI